MDQLQTGACRPESEDPSLAWEPNEDSEEIRYSLTALGVAALAEGRGPRFRGFGPCARSACA